MSDTTDPGTRTHLELLSVCLSRVEWKLVFLLDFLANSEDYGPHFTDLTRYSTPGEDPTYQVEGFRRVIRWLHDSHGFLWDGLTVLSSGEVLGTQVEPNNVYYTGMLYRGSCPDLIDAARWSLSLLEERAPGYGREVVRAALADFEFQSKRMKRLVEKKVDPKLRARVDEFTDLALQSVGVVRLDKGDNGGDVN